LLCLVKHDRTGQSPLSLPLQLPSIYGFQHGPIQKVIVQNKFDRWIMGKFSQTIPRGVAWNMGKLQDVVNTIINGQAQRIIPVVQKPRPPQQREYKKL